MMWNSCRDRETHFQHQEQQQFPWILHNPMTFLCPIYWHLIYELPTYVPMQTTFSTVPENRMWVVRKSRFDYSWFWQGWHRARCPSSAGWHRASHSPVLCLSFPICNVLTIVLCKTFWDLQMQQNKQIAARAKWGHFTVLALWFIASLPQPFSFSLDWIICALKEAGI